MPKGTLNLDLIEDTIINKDQVYSQNRLILHSAKPALSNKTPAISLIFKNEPTGNTSKVYSRSPKDTKAKIGEEG